MPKYKITENLVPSGLGQHRTRSQVIELPEGEQVPANATETDEDVRGWQVDESSRETA